MLEDLGRLRQIRRHENRHARVEAVFAKWETPEPLLALYEAATRTAGRNGTDFHSILRDAARRPALISGRHLLEIGIPADPGMEAILEKVREATLTGKVATSAEAEKLALRIFGRAKR